MRCPYTEYKSWIKVVLVTVVIGAAYRWLSNGDEISLGDFTLEIVLALSAGFFEARRARELVVDQIGVSLIPALGGAGRVSWDEMRSVYRRNGEFEFESTTFKRLRIKAALIPNRYREQAIQSIASFVDERQVVEHAGSDPIVG